MNRFLLAMLMLAGSNSIRADIIFELGNNPQPGEENVLLSSGATGTTVTGTIPGFTVDFTSTQVITEPSSGQARIQTSDGSALTDVSIALAGVSYSDIIFNPFIAPGVCSECGGDLTVTVIAKNSKGVLEAPVTFTETLGNGSNFLTILGTSGDTIVSATLDAPSGFKDLRQVRISGAAAIPEPASISYMALVLAGGIGLLRRFRKA